MEPTLFDSPPEVARDRAIAQVEAAGDLGCLAMVHTRKAARRA